jgi:hypothetical protein
MRWPFIIILFTIVLTGNCQKIKSIAIETQEADEPPTKEGRKKYSIEYKINKLGDLETSYFKVNNKRQIIKTLVIEKSKVEALESWLTLDKRDFKFSDFDTDEEEHVNYFNNSQYKLNIPIEGKIIIQTDSFAFCQGHSIQRVLSTGGYRLITTIEITNNPIRKFDSWSSDIGEHKFDLLNYLHSYKLLKNRLPGNFPRSQLFTEDFFKNFIAYYFQTIECEGYYYKEYIKMHPGRSAKQNRMKDDWNYIEFLRTLRNPKL